MLLCFFLGGHYQGARHYWPFDYETKLRDVKYSLNGTMKGTGQSITGRGRGFLRIDRNGWVRLGRFRNECLCNVKYCRKDGLSISLWVKLSIFDNGTKTLLGSDNPVITNTTGMVIFQSTLGTGNRFISAVVYMENRKWKSKFPVEPGTWFYLTVTWKESTGIRLYKDGHLMAERKTFKYKPYLVRRIKNRCSISLSPPSSSGPLVGYYDDLVIWHYELNSREMSDVFKNSFGR